MARNINFILFVVFSAAFHLVVVLADFSSQPLPQSVQQIGVGLVQRPFDLKPRNPDHQESSPRSQQPPVTKTETEKLSAQKTSAVPVEPRVQRAQPANNRELQAVVLPQPQPAAKVQSQVAKEAAVDISPVEKQLAAEVKPVRDATTAEVNQPQPAAMGVGSGAAVSATPSFGVDKAAAASQYEISKFQDASPSYDLNPPPTYPEIARRRGQQGTVLLEVLVLADGRVKKASLSESSGYKVLDRAALSAVRRWQFLPATSLGLPVESRVVVPIDFVLSGNNEGRN